VYVGGALSNTLLPGFVLSNTVSGTMTAAGGNNPSFSGTSTSASGTTKVFTYMSTNGGMQN
jgi:hypothetical protein